MKEWFEELYDIERTWGPHRSYKIYNPITGEIYIHSIFALASIAISIFNFFSFMEIQELIIAVLLGIVAFVSGIVGLVLSLRAFSYAIDYKSVFRVGVAVSGVLFSLLGMIATVASFIFVFIPIYRLLNNR